MGLICELQGIYQIRDSLDLVTDAMVFGKLNPFAKLPEAEGFLEEHAVGASTVVPCPGVVTAPACSNATFPNHVPNALNGSV